MTDNTYIYKQLYYPQGTKHMYKEVSQSKMPYRETQSV